MESCDSCYANKYIKLSHVEVLLNRPFPCDAGHIPIRFRNPVVSGCDVQYSWKSGRNLAIYRYGDGQQGGSVSGEALYRTKKELNLLKYFLTPSLHQLSGMIWSLMKLELLVS